MATMGQPKVGENGLLGRLALQAADFAERGQPDFYSYPGWILDSVTAAAGLPSTVMTAYTADYSSSLTALTMGSQDGYATLASGFAEASYTLGWTVTNQPAYAVSPALAQAAYSLAASADAALSHYSAAASLAQNSNVRLDEQIKMAVDMLIKELLARVGDTYQDANHPGGAMKAEHQNKSRSPELLWTQINALLAALVLLLGLLIYFFPPN